MKLRLRHAPGLRSQACHPDSSESIIPEEDATFDANRFCILIASERRVAREFVVSKLETLLRESLQDFEARVPSLGPQCLHAIGALEEVWSAAPDAAGSGPWLTHEASHTNSKAHAAHNLGTNAQAASWGGTEQKGDER